ncbi:predicted protein [Histoplasma capsulatum var. duboisii H88]|uniref:Predicted protein n=1 Tax=Ajellomyces capsulatus (strain H88) TaxID=544711 RepID=F0ULX4_AJEC8|nr:predicted protein [Histoplasma capsulatum var. duboisii H88]
MQCSANQQVPSAPSRRREFETRRRRYARPLEIPLFLNLHDEKLNKLKTLCPIGEFLLRSTIARHGAHVSHQVSAFYFSQSPNQNIETFPADPPVKRESEKMSYLMDKETWKSFDWPISSHSLSARQRS